MKRTLIALLTLAVMMVGGNALAASTATLNVTAEVIGACLFDSASTTLALGALDPGLGDYTTPVAHNVSYTCANGVAPLSVTVPAGGTMNSISTGGNLPYTLASVDNWDGAAFTGVIDITATVTAANMWAAPVAADYIDAQTLTITY